MIPPMGKKSMFSIKKEISLGTLVQVIGFLVSGVYYVARFEARADQAEQAQKEVRLIVEEIRAHEERVEKYLSSKDSHYWETVTRLQEEKK
jgi:hypothetical protein